MSTLQSMKLLMLRYMATPPALRLNDDDTATDDIVAICVRLAVLQYDLILKACTFTGMEFFIQVSLIAKFCLASRTSDSGALLSRCRCSIGSSLIA
ncbi:hypothetical protein TNCT_345331 [Trichonephila clavata]|uniref:Uncharacterized protein n=1 Tax=Trichonephila clavata TaxID=2740835 RepID=A0A8X6LKL9_TRICU|nr:hypothetical protein TNCT_345331 [Trichonephila clavata]